MKILEPEWNDGVRYMNISDLLSAQEVEKKITKNEDFYINYYPN